MNTERPRLKASFIIHRSSFAAVAAFLLVWFSIEPALSCPFCSSVKPTLSQLRESAAVVALGEVREVKGDSASVAMAQVLKGKHLLTGSRIEIKPEQTFEIGSLVLMFGFTESADVLLTFKAVGVNETNYAYLVRAPDLRQESATRLAYFAQFLDHADPLIVEDAFSEFAHAPFDAVVEAAGSLPYAEFRRWIVDPSYPGDRKGFLGLALGMAEEKNERAANRELLHRQATDSSDEFRAGFDGILAGYLLAVGEPALAVIEKHYLANARAAEANTWHAVRALRFYQEYGREISHVRLHAAMRLLLARDSFAAAAITDLARWQDWGSLAAVARLYDPTSTTDAAIQRAIVGYLKACPEPAAEEEIARLRKLDPKIFARAEAALDAVRLGSETAETKL